jgi:hypothetical protein
MNVLRQVMIIVVLIVAHQSSPLSAEGDTLWECQNTCYQYSSPDDVAFDPLAYPLYGAKLDHIIEGEQITFCGSDALDIQRAASVECARRHAPPSGAHVDALMTLFPAEFAGSCKAFGEACEGVGVKKVEYACVANCVKNGDSSEWYPTRFSYCSTSNRDALADGTRYYNQSGTECEEGYSLESPDLYDYVSVPLEYRCGSTGKECSTN